MPEQDELLDRVAETLREPVRLDPALDRRIMAAVEAGPTPRWEARRFRATVDWLRRGRPVTVSPLGGLALAAAFAGLLVVGRFWFAPAPDVPSAVADDVSVVQFVLVAPGASMVSLVGDFNDWDAAATPMTPAPGDGVWSITVPLEPGRYQYAFLVDGATWLRDPRAPPALEDDFGRPNSVLTVVGT